MIKVTWLGTASIRIEAAGEKILFDPFVQLIGGENPNCFADFEKDELIFITHGHLDHLMEIPEFLDPEEEAEATVYCGSAAAETLSELAEDTDNVVVVRPGDAVRIGGVTVRVLEGKHAVPGPGMTLATLCSPRNLRYMRNALALMWLNRRFPEKGQTYLYELCAEGRTVLVMGSLGLQDHVDYPTGADLLILPYQGCPNLEEEAWKVIERLKPARVMLDHFDDAFPPVSRSVDTRGLHRLLRERAPKLAVIRPTAGKTVTLG